MESKKGSRRVRSWREPFMEQPTWKIIEKISKIFNPQENPPKILHVSADFLNSSSQATGATWLTFFAMLLDPAVSHLHQS